MYFKISANKILKFFSITIIKTLEFFFLFPSIVHYYFFGNKLNNFFYYNKNLRLNYANFAKEVNIYIENNFKDIVDKEIYNNILNKKKDYYYDLLNYLPDNYIYNKIYNFLDSQEIKENISNNFNYSVKFTKFNLLVNFYNPLCAENEDSKLLHRDNDSLCGQLKLFMVLNDLSNEDFGGLFYYIPETKIPKHVKINEEKNGRVMKNLNYFTNKDFIKFGNKQGEILVLNTNDTYHKGGYINKENCYRLMIVAIYTPKFFSISILEKAFKYNFLYKILTKFLIFFKNKVRTYI